jgi:uncharacterized membrane protein
MIPMSVSREVSSEPVAVPPRRPFRRAVLGGLGVVLPPLLTVVLFLWAWNLISHYVLEPLENGACHTLTWATWDVRCTPPPPEADDRYARLGGSEVWIPRRVYATVQNDPGTPRPQTAREYFERYVRLFYLRRWLVVPLFLVLFVLVMYGSGKFFGAGVGRWLWGAVEGLVARVPVVRNVYSAVKQVTEFLVRERAVEFRRVVAVEYPRRGVWAIAFVTGEGLPDVGAAANEPVLSLLIPTSPMPATGLTAMVRKSDVIDLNITLDQAIQYIVSCGVVVPPHQPSQDPVAQQIAAALTARETG